MCITAALSIHLSIHILYPLVISGDRPFPTPYDQTPLCEQVGQLVVQHHQRICWALVLPEPNKFVGNAAQQVGQLVRIVEFGHKRDQVVCHLQNILKKNMKLLKNCMTQT
jgi:hypothetical protein